MTTPPPSDYEGNVSADTRQLLIDVDDEVSALLGGSARQTLSMRSALAARAGKRWGCLLCWYLSRFVQPDHCKRTLAGDPMPRWVFLTAGASFVFWGIVVPVVVVLLLARLL